MSSLFSYLPSNTAEGVKICILYGAYRMVVLTVKMRAKPCVYFWKISTWMLSEPICLAVWLASTLCHHLESWKGHRSQHAPAASCPQNLLTEISVNAWLAFSFPPCKKPQLHQSTQFQLLKRSRILVSSPEALCKHFHQCFQCYQYKMRSHARCYQIIMWWYHITKSARRRQYCKGKSVAVVALQRW